MYDPIINYELKSGVAITLRLYPYLLQTCKKLVCMNTFATESASKKQKEAVKNTPVMNYTLKSKMAITIHL